MRKKRARGRHLPWRTYLVVLGVLVVLRVLLPFAVTAYVERQLDGIENHEASLGDLDVTLWRGAYEIENVALWKGAGGAEEPFLEAARIDLAIHWGALLGGAIRGDVTLHRPVLRFVLDEEEERSQTGADVSWGDRMQALFPFYIDRLAARDGQLHYERRVGEEVVDLYLTDLYLALRNLTNLRETDEPLDAVAEAAGRPFGTGEAEAVMRFDPLADQPRFELNAELREVRLADLNDYLVTYAGVDAQEGTVGIFVEIAIDDGRFEGYVKTLLEDVEVLRADEIEGPGDALEALWEGIVAGAAEVLENQPHDRLATRVPLEGTTSSVGTDLLTVVVVLLENAFVDALRPVLDHSVELEDAAVSEAEESS